VPVIEIIRSETCSAKDTLTVNSGRVTNTCDIVLGVRVYSAQVWNCENFKMWSHSYNSRSTSERRRHKTLNSAVAKVPWT